MLCYLIEGALLADTNQAYSKSKLLKIEKEKNRKFANNHVWEWINYVKVGI